MRLSLAQLQKSLPHHHYLVTVYWKLHEGDSKCLFELWRTKSCFQIARSRWYASLTSNPRSYNLLWRIDKPLYFKCVNAKHSRMFLINTWSLGGNYHKESLLTIVSVLVMRQADYSHQSKQTAFEILVLELWGIKEDSRLIKTYNSCLCVVLNVNT